MHSIHSVHSVHHGLMSRLEAAGHKLRALIAGNTVMFIALIAAIITVLIVPIDRAYVQYFDFKTLSCLFCVLAVVCALKDVNFFYMLAARIVHVCKTARMSVLALVYITFIGSMLIANDMALITFLPLGYFVFSVTDSKRDMAVVFILQNIAANLGGMLTPFGNPQNLYLYAHYHIANGEFVSIMFPPFAVSIALITLCCLLLPKRALRIQASQQGQGMRLPPARTAFYLALFALTILMVFRLLPAWLVLAILIVSLLIADRKALKMVDYCLLLTFVCFFTFAGNMARLAPVRNVFSSLLQRNTLLTAVLSCQCISNVPSAILLSQFTQNYPALLVGVNIGGAGTLIASLASLITFREFSAHYRGEGRFYIKLFSAFNFSFLLILTLFSLLVCRIS